MAGDLRAVDELARTNLVSEIAGPDIYYAALIAGPASSPTSARFRSPRGGVPGHLPWMQTVEDDTDLPLAVAEARGTYATAVKLYADLSPQLATRVTAEANRQHMLVWANATLYPAKPSEGVSAGVDVVSHACLLVRETQDHGHGWGEPHFAHDTDKKVMAAKTHSQVGRLTMTLQMRLMLRSISAMTL